LFSVIDFSIDEGSRPMKQDKNEVAAVEAAAKEGEGHMVELAELQLAMVGGGIGDVVFS
jgi:hypothetical protein